MPDLMDEQSCSPLDLKHGIAGTRIIGENPEISMLAVTWNQLYAPHFWPGPVTEEVTRECIRATRELHKDDHRVTKVGVDQLIPIPAFAVSPEDLSVLLLAFFQNHSVDGVGPFEYAFTPHTTQPVFGSATPAELGYLLHVLTKHPETTKSAMAKCGIMKDLTITISPENVGGYMMVGGTLFAQDAVSLVEPNITTFADFGNQNEFYCFGDLYKNSGYCTFDADNIVFYGLELTLNNNAKRIGYDANGQLCGWSLGPWTVEGTIRMLADEDSDAYIADWLASTKDAFALRMLGGGGVFGTNIGDFEIKIPVGQVTNLPTGDQERIYEIAFKGTVDGSNKSIQITTAANFALSVGTAFFRAS